MADLRGGASGSCPGIMSFEPMSAPDPPFGAPQGLRMADLGGVASDNCPGIVSFEPMSTPDPPHSAPHGLRMADLRGGARGSCPAIVSFEPMSGPDPPHSAPHGSFGTEHGSGMKTMRDWLDAEVVARLCDIDRKLEQLSAKVDGSTGNVAGYKPAGLTQSHHAPKPSFLATPSVKSMRPSHQRVTHLQAKSLRDASNAPTSRRFQFSVFSDASFDVEDLRWSMQKQRLKLWTVMHDQDSSFTARCYAATLRYLVWISVMVTLTQTLKPPPISALTAVVLETMFDSIFLLEIVARFAVCPSRTKFFVNTFNIIDMLASVPLFMRASTGFQSLAREDEDGCTPACVILLYVAPIIKILKTLRSFRKFQLLLSAFVLAFEALPVLLFTMMVIVMSFASLIYLVEPRSNIESLPMAMYFTIITMTTVGYGDITPTTVGGHVAVSLCTVTGALYMAMPIGIIGSAFTQTWQRRDRILLTNRIRENLFQGGHTMEDIPQLFEEFDLDGNGVLHLREFRRLIHHLRIGLSDDRIIELFHTIDTNRGGSIEASEFMRMLFPERFHAMTEAGALRGPKSPSWGKMTNSVVSTLLRSKTHSGLSSPQLRPNSTESASIRVF